MAAAAAVADPALNEFEIGGRWFPCVAHIDPVVIWGVTRRAKRPPTDPTDPTLPEWLSAVVGFLLAACEPAEHDRLVTTLTGIAGENPDAAAAQIADVFGGLLAIYSDHEVAEIREHIAAAELADAHQFPAREVPAVRRRTQVDEIQRIQARHGSKATGEVL